MAKKINELSGMPQMRAAFSGWMYPFVLVRITQDVVNGFVQDAEQTLNFEGTIQPLSPEEIALKPDGQRSWEWLQIHVFKGENLVTNDRVRYNGVDFKVMAVKDYSLNNYVEYHLIKDYSE